MAWACVTSERPHGCWSVSLTPSGQGWAGFATLAEVVLVVSRASPLLAPMVSVFWEPVTDCVVAVAPPVDEL